MKKIILITIILSIIISCNNTKSKINAEKKLVEENFEIISKYYGKYIIVECYETVESKGEYEVGKLNIGKFLQISKNKIITYDDSLINNIKYIVNNDVNYNNFHDFYLAWQVNRFFDDSISCIVYDTESNDKKYPNWDLQLIIFSNNNIYIQYKAFVYKIQIMNGSVIKSLEK